MDLSVEAECFGAEIRVSEDEVPTVVGSVVSTEEEAEALEIPPIGSGRTGLYIDAIRQAAEEITDVSLMDLSVEAECFGAEIRVSEDEVPTVVGSVVSTEEEAEALEIPPIGSGRTGLYIDAIRQAAEEITDRPVFAGVIGPYSLAGRLMDVTEIMILCYEEPDMVHAVLKKVTRFLTDYCLAYKEAGANGVIMAESLAGILSPALEEEFSEPYVRELVEAVQDDSFAVIYHNCGGGVSMMASSIASTGAAVFHFGNAVDMEEMLEKMLLTKRRAQTEL